MFYGKKNIIAVSFDTTLEGVILIDTTTEIIAVNDAIESCLGYSPEEIIHRKVNFLIPKHKRNIHQKHLRNFFNKASCLSFDNSREVIGLHKDGRIIPFEFRLNQFEHEGKKYAKALIIDISERKEKELKIKKAKMKLEKEVHKKNKELESLVSQLKLSNINLEKEINKKITAQNKARKALIVERELNQLKTKFLSMASHEFRTPLSGILTSATLINKHTKVGQANIIKHTDVIKSMVKHLSNILEDFLSLDKLERGEIKYKFTDFNLNDLIENIITEISPLLRKGQVINYRTCKGCINMKQDKKIIHIIFINILYNAIKYSPENSPIDLVVTDGDIVTISIIDKGIGIPKSDQKNIFKKFYRASNTKHIQGTGIGLNIVKSNILGLGGDIYFTSKENSGTNFIIKLPKSVAL